jgi:hypothetical protein
MTQTKRRRGGKAEAEAKALPATSGFSPKTKGSRGSRSAAAAAAAAAAATKTRCPLQSSATLPPPAAADAALLFLLPFLLLSPRRLFLFIPRPFGSPPETGASFLRLLRFAPAAPSSPRSLPRPLSDLRPPAPPPAAALCVFALPSSPHRLPTARRSSRRLLALRCAIAPNSLVW